MSRHHRYAWLAFSAAFLVVTAYAEDAPEDVTMMVVEEGAMPEDIVGEIELPAGAAQEAHENAAKGLETANAAREGGRAFGQARAEEARAEAAATGDDAQESAESTAEAARESAENVAESARESAGGVAEEARETAENAADAARESAKDIAESIRDAAQAMRENDDVGGRPELPGQAGGI